jgi:hypothetical protein
MIMRRGMASKIGVLVAIGALAGLVAVATADQVRLGPLVLTANGGFEPRLLPKDSYAPIRFHGNATIEMLNGAQPPALRRLRLDFDRDGKLTTAGLATCSRDSIAAASPAQARQTCAAALVGTGSVTARIALPGHEPVDVRSPLSLFNGPRHGGSPTVIAHARNTFPTTEIFAVVIPIEQRRGVYRYRAIFDIPPIAGGAGSITRAEARVGRRYRAGGEQRSYVAARCSDGILQTLGLASFADGTVISGSLFKPCRALP